MVPLDLAKTSLMQVLKMISIELTVVKTVSQNWGGAPYEDIMAGVDFALQNYSWIDQGLCPF